MKVQMQMQSADGLRSACSHGVRTDLAPIIALQSEICIQHSLATMSDFLPLFPLPNVVLFPNVFLPLHVFEPRYREMVADAVASDRMIGIVLLRPGWEDDYDGRPPIYPDRLQRRHHARRAARRRLLQHRAARDWTGSR